jgi:hypothetical protein
MSYSTDISIITFASSAFDARRWLTPGLRPTAPEHNEPPRLTPIHYAPINAALTTHCYTASVGLQGDYMGLDGVTPRAGLTLCWSAESPTLKHS